MNVKKLAPPVTMPDPPVGPRLLTAEEVAAYLHISVQTLAVRRMHGGPLSPPFTRLGGPTSRPYYRADRFEKWMSERGEHTSTHEERVALYAAKKAKAPKRTRRARSIGGRS